MANLTYASTEPLGRAGNDSNGTWSDQFPFALSQSLMLMGKIAWLLLLTGLFVLSFFAWIWILSFRGGWRLWDWVAVRSRPEEVSIGLLYGLLVLLVSPFFLFFDWAQTQFEGVLPDWMRLPEKIPFRERFEAQLGIVLGDEFPFFLEKTEETEESQTPALSENSDVQG